MILDVTYSYFLLLLQFETHIKISRLQKADYMKNLLSLKELN